MRLFLSFIIFNFMCLELNYAAKQNPIKQACTLLQDQRIAMAFPEAKSLLCEKKTLDCSTKLEKECDLSNLCRSVRGSGSGEHCTQCTPDMVFWRCESLSAEIISERILSYQSCLKSGGRWETKPKFANINGLCQRETAHVEGVIINTKSSDFTLFVDGVEIQNIITNNHFGIAVYAGVPTVFRITENKTKKSIEKKISLDPNKRIRLEFVF